MENMIFAKRMSQLKASEIREILKVTEQPGVISFAGGLPAPELFPIEEIARGNGHLKLIRKFSEPH